MRSLIIGNGQIGSALFEIFSKVHETHVRDFEAVTLHGIEVLHISYPYSDKFVRNTLDYIDEYRPKLTIIHSTVKVGTTDQCGPHVVHSPERGRWPNLAAEMVQFTKFIGGNHVPDLQMANQYLRLCNWKTQLVNDPKITETLKLLSNAHMGLEIAWRQQIEQWGVEPDTYAMWEDSYFAGYLWLGQKKLIRSRMRPDPIGGHCVLPSIDILSQTHPSLVLEFIKDLNEHVKREKSQKDGARNGGSGVATAPR